MTDNSTVSLNRIKQIAIPVRELDRATSFYRSRLGMNFLFEVPKMAFFDCGGVRIMLAAPEKPGFDHPASIIYFEVDNIRRAFEELRDREVIFEGEPHLIARLPDREVWMAFFRDTEQNLLALTSEVPLD